MSNVSTTTAAIYQAVLDSLNSSGECGVLPPAPPGKSAYEVAVANGFKGSEKQWLDSLTLEQENEIARLEARILANENYRKDSKNAASRLVGTNSGNVMQVRAFGLGSPYLDSIPPVREITKTEFTLFQASLFPDGQVAPAVSMSYAISGGGRTGFALASPRFSSSVYSIHRNGATLQVIAKLYSDKNTTVDSNKNIKTSSPVVRVFKDHLDKIHEANDLPIKYTRNGVGDYTIEGTTGLRENDWQIVIPKDDHDNQLIAFTMEDDNGTIKLKTYKRTFNMTTFMFEPDLSTPLDIPEGRWVDLHFNDIPQEELDEPEPEEDPKD